MDCEKVVLPYPYVTGENGPEVCDWASLGGYICRLVAMMKRLRTDECFKTSACDVLDGNSRSPASSLSDLKLDFDCHSHGDND